MLVATISTIDGLVIKSHGDIIRGLEPLAEVNWKRQDMRDFWHAYSAPPDGFHKFALVTKLLDFHGLGRKSRSEVHLSRLEGALRRAGLAVDSRNRVSGEAFNNISDEVTDRGDLHSWLQMALS